MIFRKRKSEAAQEEYSDGSEYSEHSDDESDALYPHHMGRSSLQTSSPTESRRSKSTKLKPISEVELSCHLDDFDEWASGMRPLLSKGANTSPISAGSNTTQKDDRDFDAEEPFSESDTSPISPAEQTQWLLDCEFDGQEITLNPVNDYPDSPKSVCDLRERLRVVNGF
jgi:hypothetical protein